MMRLYVLMSTSELIHYNKVIIKMWDWIQIHYCLIKRCNVFKRCEYVTVLSCVSTRHLSFGVLPDGTQSNKAWCVQGNIIYERRQYNQSQTNEHCHALKPYIAALIPFRIKCNMIGHPWSYVGRSSFEKYIYMKLIYVYTLDAYWSCALYYL